MPWTWVDMGWIIPVISGGSARLGGRRSALGSVSQNLNVSALWQAQRMATQKEYRPWGPSRKLQLGRVSVVWVCKPYTPCATTLGRPGQVQQTRRGKCRR